MILSFYGVLKQKNEPVNDSVTDSNHDRDGTVNVYFPDRNEMLMAHGYDPPAVITLCISSIKLAGDTPDPFHEMKLGRFTDLTILEERHHIRNNRDVIIAHIREV